MADRTSFQLISATELISLESASSLSIASQRSKYRDTEAGSVRALIITPLRTQQSVGEFGPHQTHADKMIPIPNWLSEQPTRALPNPR